MNIKAFKVFSLSLLLTGTVSASWLVHANPLNIHVTISDADSVPRLHVTDGEHIIQNLGNAQNGEVKEFIRSADMDVALEFDPAGNGNFYTCQLPDTGDIMIPAAESDVFITLNTDTSNRSCTMSFPRYLVVNTFAKGVDDSSDSITFNLQEYLDSDPNVPVNETSYAVTTDSWNNPVRHNHLLKQQDFSRIDLLFNGQVEYACPFEDGSEPRDIRDLDEVDLVVYADSGQCYLYTDWVPPTPADISFKTAVMGVGDTYETTLVFTETNGHYRDEALVSDGVFRQGFDKIPGLAYGLTAVLADDTSLTCQYQGSDALIDDNFSVEHLVVDAGENTCYFSDDPVAVPLDFTLDLGQLATGADYAVLEGYVYDSLDQTRLVDEFKNTYEDIGQHRFIYPRSEDVEIILFAIKYYDSNGQEVSVDYCNDYHNWQDYFVYRDQFEVTGMVGSEPNWPGEVKCIYEDVKDWDNL